MRILTVDVGNTSTAVGLWTDGRVGSIRHIDGNPRTAVAAFADWSGVRVEHLAYASVVPKADRLWRTFARQKSLTFHAVSHRAFDGRRLGGLRLDYPHPETIGADRLADAAGAVARYGAPVLVMDFGTALTAAIVTKDRVWRGGVIAPGFPLMRDYLFERTAQLPRMTLGTGKAPRIGRTTEEAMRFGALVGYRGMVREIVHELKRNFHEEFKLIATGGFARWALKGLDLPFVIDSSLTLYGTGLVCAAEI